MKEEKESKLIMALGNSGSLLAEAQTDSMAASPNAFIGA